jgi:uncharacterized protein
MGKALDTGLILEIARRHGASRVRVFGSYARGQQTENSDLDLLVVLDPQRDLFDLVDLRSELESRLGCRVDVVTENGLSPYIRAGVLREARPL